MFECIVAVESCFLSKAKQSKNLADAGKRDTILLVVVFVLVMVMAAP